MIFYSAIVTGKEEAMRLGLLISDIEYRKALVSGIAEYDGDIILDVINPGDDIEADALILTDAKPADIDKLLLEKIHYRTVFLITNTSSFSSCSNIYTCFKYSSISRLMAEVSDIHQRWRGVENRSAVSSRIIACCSDSDAFSQSSCSALARQIIYRHGGSIVIVPLGYINEEGMDFAGDINRFARLMYMVESGRDTELSSITYTDSYGISRLMLPKGRNPIAYLEEDDLIKLILYISMLFESVILDIAGCYRKENLSAIRNAHSALIFETGRRRLDFKEIVGSEIKNIRTVKLTEGSDEAFAVDEYVKELYGVRDVE